MLCGREILGAPGKAVPPSPVGKYRDGVMQLYGLAASNTGAETRPLTRVGQCCDFIINSSCGKGERAQILWVSESQSCVCPGYQSFHEVLLTKKSIREASEKPRQALTLSLLQARCCALQRSKISSGCPRRGELSHNQQGWVCASEWHKD